MGSAVVFWTKNIMIPNIKFLLQNVYTEIVPHKETFFIGCYTTSMN